MWRHGVLLFGLAGDLLEAGRVQAAFGLARRSLLALTILIFIRCLGILHGGGSFALCDGVVLQHS